MTHLKNETGYREQSYKRSTILMYDSRQRCNDQKFAVSPTLQSKFRIVAPFIILATGQHKIDGQLIGIFTYPTKCTPTTRSKEENHVKTLLGPCRSPRNMIRYLAKLVKRSLLNSEICRSNPTIFKVLLEHCSTKGIEWTEKE